MVAGWRLDGGWMEAEWCAATSRCRLHGSLGDELAQPEIPAQRGALFYVTSTASAAPEPVTVVEPSMMEIVTVTVDVSSSMRIESIEPVTP